MRAVAALTLLTCPLYCWIPFAPLAESDFTVRLKDAPGGTENRGEVSVKVWFGPPVRKAFRAAQRASKLLDIRDSVVSTLWALVSGVLGSKYLQG